MAAINGWRLIRQNGSTVTYYLCGNGQIEHDPGLKHRIEKRNAFDPSRLHRRGAYREDTFELSATLLPGEYADLITILSGAGNLYLEYTTAAGSASVQYPVVPGSLPKCPDDLHEYPEKIKFSLISRFVGSPGYVDFSYIIINDDDETVIVVNPN